MSNQRAGRTRRFSAARRELCLVDVEAANGDAWRPVMLAASPCTCARGTIVDDLGAQEQEQESYQAFAY